MNIKKNIVSILSFCVLFSTANFALAVGPDNNSMTGLLKNAGENSGYSEQTNELSMAGFIGRIIMIMLSLLGVIFLVLTFYAGFLWFTAGGDDKKVQTAKDYLKNAVIGLIIVLASMSITSFVVGNLTSSKLLGEQTKKLPDPRQ